MPVKTKKWLYIGIGSGAGALLLILLLVLLLPGKQPADQPEETAAPTESTAPEETAPPENPFTGETVSGIDVSSHQKQVDWQKVKEAGMEFVMIRLAYRGSIEGALIPDEMAQTHYEGAKAAGLKVGGYIFTQSISVAEGIEDAQYVLELSKDWELDMPLVYDWEIIKDSYRNGNVDKQTLTDTMQAFCDTVEEAGHRSMVYFNITNTKENFYLDQLEGCLLWLAYYSPELDFDQPVDMWQYTASGSVPGIEGDVDINLYFPREE